MKKTFGAQERHDQLLVYGKGKKAILIYGYGEENGQGYDWRHEFTHRPTKQEVLHTIISHVNQLTDQKILNGFVWNDKPVYLSSENQFNFKTVYDIAVQTKGKNLPVKFKLGETESGTAVYHVFENMSGFADFYTQATSFIMQTLNDGWTEKDAATEWVETLSI